MSQLCLECGAVVPRRQKEHRGKPPGFCSDACRRKRKLETTRRWIAANHARKLATDAEYRKRFKAEDPDYFKRFYAANRDRRKQEASRWYHENSERALDTRREYVAANRDKARVWGRRSANTRRAITKRVFVEVVDARTVFERDNGICGICKREVDVASNWEVDHIVPISKGGLHAYANVQLAHRKCNRSKAAKVA